MLREHNKLIMELQKSLDIGITVVSFFAAYLIKKHLLPEELNALAGNLNYYLILMMIIAAWYISFNWIGAYITYRNSEFYSIFVKIIKSTFAGLLLFSGFVFIFKIKLLSRLFIGIFFVVNIFLLTLVKYIIYVWLSKIRKDGLNIRFILIVGSRMRAVEAIMNIEKRKASGFRILGNFDIGSTEIGKKVYNNYKIIGSMENLEHFLRNNTVDGIVFAMPLKLIENAERYLSLVESMGIKVWIIPDWQIHYLMYQPGIANIHFEEFFGLPTMSFSTTTFNEGKLFIKNTIDKVVASFLFILTLPLYVIIAVAIKMKSKGPVLYKQERLGLNGRKFNLLKFRTMVNGADRLLYKLKNQNEADGPTFKIKNDPRIIPLIGTVLRKTSLDELPQLINVLRGQMSLVGPRPPIPEEVEAYSVWQRRRLSIKPGLTCYWQIAARRNELSFEEWMHLDLKYIDSWSIFVDIKLIFLTAKAVLTGAGR